MKGERKEPEQPRPGHRQEGGSKCPLFGQGDDSPSLSAGGWFSGSRVLGEGDGFPEGVGRPHGIWRERNGLEHEE